MTADPDELEDERDDEGAEEEGDEEGADDEDLDDEPPSAIVATLADLGRYLPEPLRKSFGDRPIWFIREDDQELVEIFDRVPEDPMPKGRAHELLRALRTFADDHSDPIQQVLGSCEGIVYGFHGDATLDRVKRAFEEDGFVVCTGIVRSGEVVIPEA